MRLHWDVASAPRALVVGFVMLLPLSACGDEEGSASDAGAGGDDAAIDAGGQQDTGVAAHVSPGCDKSAVAAGDSDESLSFAGASRGYLLHVPEGLAAEPAPLVINLHGFLSNYKEQVGLTGTSNLADAEGFVVVYPNGAGEPPAWNAGDCCEFVDTKRDDVAFVAAVIDTVGDSTCIDLDRVYVMGFSNGGFLAHRLACELSERVAAIASVSGPLGVAPEDCEPTRPVPVLQIHGDADNTVAYTGGSPMGWELLYPDVPAPTFRSAAASIEFWRDHDGCEADSEAGYAQGDAACVTYGGCDEGSEVELCTITGGGHAWPGGDPSAQLGTVNGIPVVAFQGKTSMDLDASQHIWEFFARHALR